MKSDTWTMGREGRCRTVYLRVYSTELFVISRPFVDSVSRKYKPRRSDCTAGEHYVGLRMPSSSCAEFTYV